LGIFQNSVLRNQKQDESLVALRWAQFQNYISKIDFIKTVKEEKFQDSFLKDIFESCLGYTLDSTNPSNFNLEREKKNETDSKKADGVIVVNGEIIGIVELKDQKTKNLDAVESQAFNYHASHSNSKYIIISNFDELRFYIDKKTAYEKFNLFNLSYEDFKTLHLLISYESIRDNIPLKLKEKSTNFEQTISKELYRDFSAFRTHLFENIIKNNYTVHPEPVEGSSIDKQTLLRLTQKLCDRIIFILFAEDRGLLRANTIKEIREEFHAQKFTSYTLYDIYKFYFNAINEGNTKLNIPRYNGGLFATDALLDSLVIDDAYLDMEAQKLSDFDFVSDISVNILGHIFEQSLTDLEEINASINDTEFDRKKSKRKKDGVFYTPEYITRYIVENTLGKLCSDKKASLGLTHIEEPQNPKKLTKAENETLAKLYEYREYLLNLKILDPACGSGAFLNQALEFLIREHKNVDDYRRAYENEMLSLYDIETNILEHNLYGVDINEDAVEIAKLSLWLRTAQKGHALTNLSGKIKCGNSLIADKSVVENAFVWEEEFPEVFEQGGFDVVIGNPPYVRQEMLVQEAKNYFASNYDTYHGMADLYVFFVERAFKLLKIDGRFSYIFPNKWMRAGYGKPLRSFLMNKHIEEIIDFGDLPVFEDATTYPLILTMQQSKPKENFQALELTTLDFGDLAGFVAENAHTVSMQELDENNFSMGGSNAKLLQKFAENSVTLSTYLGGEAYRGVLTGLNEAFVIDEKIKNELIANDSKSSERIKPFLAGKDVKRYEIPTAEKYLILFPKGFTREQSGCSDELEAWAWLSQTYPAIAEWLEPFTEKGRKRTDKGEFWWELRACGYYDEFEKQKIMYQVFQVKPAFIYDVNNTYCNNAIWMLPKDDKVLLAILNSKIGWFLISSYCTAIQNGYQLIWKYLEQIHIPTNITNEHRGIVEKLVDQQLELNQSAQKTKQNFHNELHLEKIPKKLQNFEELEFDDFVKEYTKAKKLKFADKLEERNFKNDWSSLFENDKKAVLELKEQIAKTDKEIDAMVYKLYGLSEDEIEIVERKNGI